MLIQTSQSVESQVQLRPLQFTNVSNWFASVWKASETSLKMRWVGWTSLPHGISFFSVFWYRTFMFIDIWTFYHILSYIIIIAATLKWAPLLFMVFSIDSLAQNFTPVWIFMILKRFKIERKLRIWFAFFLKYLR